MSGDIRKALAAIIPVYNAGDRVRSVAEGLLKQTPKVYVVNDGSSDGCVEPLRELPVEILDLTPNRGKGYALMQGYAAAMQDSEVECVASLDADGQHDPAELPALFAAFNEAQADLLIGSRQFDGDDVPFRSRFGNLVTITVTARLLGRRLPDTQSGYRLLSRRFIEAMIPRVPGGRYETEMELIARAVAGDYNVASASIRTIYEEGNKSSHFRKVSDSIRIYRKLIGLSFFRSKP